MTMTFEKQMQGIARSTFVLLLEAKKRLLDRYYGPINDAFMEAEMGELQGKWKQDPEKKRKKFVYSTAVEAYPEVFKYWREGIGEPLSNAILSAKTAIDRMLDDLAEFAEVVPGKEWTVGKVVWDSDYNTQGLGALQYARQSAELFLQEAVMATRGSGIKFRLRIVKRKLQFTNGYGYRFQAEVKADPVDVEIIKRRKPASLVEWVTWCWKRGVNPRVYNPFLPHGFEEKHGIAYTYYYPDGTPCNSKRP